MKIEIRDHKKTIEVKTPEEKTSSEEIKVVKKTKSSKKPDTTKTNPVEELPKTNQPRKRKVKHSSPKKTATGVKNFITKHIKVISILLFFIVVVIIIAVIITTPKINYESYFVTDDSKDVITLEVSEEDAARTNLIRSHIVYTYDNDKITSLKTYYEYDNNESAKKSIGGIRNANQNAESIIIDDNYIIVAASRDQYENLAPKDIKQQAEAIRQYQAKKKNKENNSD